MECNRKEGTHMREALVWRGQAEPLASFVVLSVCRIVLVSFQKMCYNGFHWHPLATGPLVWLSKLLRSVGVAEEGIALERLKLAQYQPTDIREIALQKRESRLSD